MKIIRLLFLSLLLVILLSACSNKPKDVSQEFWDEAIQITLYIDEQTAEIENVRSNLVNGLGAESEKISKGENKINRDLFNLAEASGSYSSARPLIAEEGEVGEYEEEYKRDYDEAYVKLETLFGSSILEETELDESGFEDIIAKYKEIGIAENNAKIEVDVEIREQKKEAAEAKKKQDEEDLEWAKDKNPTLGMTREQVLASLWGKPTDVNRTVNKYGTNEQWVYRNYKYLYFTDGILTSFQD